MFGFKLRCSAPLHDRNSSRTRLQFEALEDRTVPSTVLFEDTYSWAMSGVPDAATVAVTVTEDAPGHEGEYLWEYHIVNNGYGFSGIEDIGMFVVSAGDPGTVADLDGTTGWYGSVGMLMDDPELVAWQAGEFDDLIAVDEWADFSFTTPPTAITLRTGFVSDFGFAGQAGGPVAAPAPALVVNTNLDVVNENDALFSLREAIIYANGPQNLAGHQRITFASYLAGATITLNPNADDGYGQLSIQKKIFVDGLANKITVQRDPNAEQKHRLFYVAGTGEARLAHLKLKNGFVEGNNGGAVISFGKLTVDDCEIRNNKVTYATGGGIQAQAGKLTVTGDSIIEDNTAEIGGGIFVNSEVSAFITDSLIKNNTANISGGGIGVNSSTTATPTLVVLTNTEVIYNKAQSKGGGIYVSKAAQGAGTDLLLLSNTCLGSNQVLGAVGEGGGLYFGAGNLTLSAIIISNTATKGNGIYRVGGVTFVVPTPDVLWGGGNVMEVGS